MAFKITDLFKLTGLAAGAQNANVKAAAGLIKLQRDVTAGAERLGARIGDYTGGGIFQALAKGAGEKDRVETENFLAENVGTTFGDVKGYLLLAAAGVAGYFLLRD